MSRGKERGEQIWGWRLPWRGRNNTCKKVHASKAEPQRGVRALEQCMKVPRNLLYSVYPDRYGCIWQQGLVARASDLVDLGPHLQPYDNFKP